MKYNVTIRTISLILILTTLFSLCGCGAAPSQEEELPEETLLEEVPEETEEPEQAQEEEQMKPGYIPKDVPLYDQRKYTKVVYGPGAVANYGCGISCAAMAISYYTGYEVTPGYLGEHYDIRGLSFQQRMLKALDDFNVEVVAEYYGKKEWPKVYEALEEGYMVISLQATGLFTASSHFLLLTGLTEDGKVLVNDPNGMNYKRNVRDLKDGFANGFEPNLITNGGGNYYVLEFTGVFVPFGIEPSPYSHTIIEQY